MTENQPTRVIVNFGAPGTADPLDVQASGGLTDGQMIVAGFYLVSMSLYKILKNLGFQDEVAAKEAAEKARQEAMVQSLGVKLDQERKL